MTFPVLETERLVLREIVPSDAEALFEFRSDAEAQKHNDPPFTDIGESYALIERFAAEFRTAGNPQWGLTVKGPAGAEPDVVVGLLGFNYWAREHHRAAIGYNVSRPLWGRGLASEAMRAVLDHGFGAMDLNRIEAWTNEENVESIRMLRRLGFWQEGTLHDQFFEHGTFHDVALFVMLRRDR